MTFSRGSLCASWHLVKSISMTHNDWHVKEQRNGTKQVIISEANQWQSDTACLAPHRWRGGNYPERSGSGSISLPHESGQVKGCPGLRQASSCRAEVRSSEDTTLSSCHVSERSGPAGPAQGKMGKEQRRQGRFPNESKQKHH